MSSTTVRNDAWDTDGLTTEWVSSTTTGSIVTTWARLNPRTGTIETLQQYPDGRALAFVNTTDGIRAESYGSFATGGDALRSAYRMAARQKRLGIKRG
jgi:hypothetical protein